VEGEGPAVPLAIPGAAAEAEGYIIIIIGAVLGAPSSFLAKPRCLSNHSHLCSCQVRTVQWSAPDHFSWDCPQCQGMLQGQCGGQRGHRQDGCGHGRSLRNIRIIVQTQNDSGHFKEVKEEPLKEEKGKERAHEERKKAVVVFLKGQGF
jgi:hypothetical protein